MESGSGGTVCFNSKSLHFAPGHTVLTYGNIHADV